jgi:Torsin
MIDTFANVRQRLPWVIAVAGVLLSSWFLWHTGAAKKKSFGVGTQHLYDYVYMAVVTGTASFVPNACQNAEHLLRSNVEGQDVAIDQLLAAVCSHVSNKASKGPLVISAHGPPGVGKTWTHQLLARALYSNDGSECPGGQCSGYKVLGSTVLHLQMNQGTSQVLCLSTGKHRSPLANESGYFTSTVLKYWFPL